MAEVGQKYPGTNETITGKVKNPNGPGYWLVGEFGGVFAEEGAPFHGSYFSLPAEVRNDPNRRFTGIVAEGGGYRIMSNTPGEMGYFLGPTQVEPIQSPPPTGPPSTPTGSTPPPGENTSGRDLFTSSLVTMGFTRDQATSLANSLWGSSKTKSPDALYFDLIGSAEYAERFPGMKALRDQGTAISESQYVTLERQYMSVAESAGLPATFRERSDFGQLIAKGVSPDEYASRVRWAQTAALSDPILMDEIARQNGNPIGDATAFYLDPNRGTQVLEDQRIKAETGAAARRSGFGQLSQNEIDQLWSGGLTADQAQERFNYLASQSGLVANTVGETLTDDQFTRQEQLSTVADPTGLAAQELDTRRKRRQASFQGGGGAVAGGGGKTGLS